MVLLGGLEIVAAGYVLNELHKDNKPAPRSSSQQPHHRRRKHRDSSSRPQRPPQQNLMPPQPHGLQRPNSAPPQQFGPPRMNSAPPQGLGPGPNLGPTWMHPNQPFSQPQQAQTWHHPPPQTQQQPYQQPQTQHRPSAPAGSAYAGTVAQMYFDTKTGKWQSGMLPPEMPQAGHGSRERSISNSNSRPRDRSGQHRSYSSGSDSYGSDSADSDLAYGKMPGQRSHSHQRERPAEYAASPPPPYLEREHDWYANQNFAQSQPVLQRENRAATLSATQLGSSAPRPGYAELDAETPGRYRPHKN